MGLTVTVLGCSGSYPAEGDACSGYLVQSDGFNLVVDLGPGTLANLQRHAPLPEIDAVVLSHSHPDHWTDLAGLRTALRYRFGCEGLPVYGTSDTHELAAALTSSLEPTFDWHHTGDGDEFELGPFRLRLSRTDHYVETLAVRGGNELVGFCFTPQDGNALLSLIAATLWYLHGDLGERLHVLRPFLFQEV